MGFGFRGALLAALVLANACLSESEAVPLPGPAQVNIGAGFDAFADLTDGDAVQVEAGPQGGLMVVLAIEAGGIVPGDPSDPSHPDNPRMTFRAIDASTDAVLGILTQQKGLSLVGEDGAESLGSWLVFNPSIETSVYFDQEIRIEVLLVDVHGVTVEDQVRVTARAPITMTSLNLDFDPGEVVGRPGYDSEHVSRHVRRSKQEIISATWLTSVRVLEARLVGHIPHDPIVRIVDAKNLYSLAFAHDEEFIAGRYAGVAHFGHMQKDVTAECPLQRVGPLGQRSGTQQEMVRGCYIHSVFCHAEATFCIRSGGGSLDV